MGSKCFLLTTPEHDDTTTYCSKWSNEIIETAKDKSFEIINLDREKANRTNFESRINKNNPVFVMFNGHGSPTVIRGHDDKIILKYGDNEKLVKDRVVYARSCDSASKLGVGCRDNGVTAFIGYKLAFMFIMDSARSTSPLKDELAGPFFRVSNSIPLSLLKGNSVKEAVKKSDTQLEKEVEYLKTHYSPEAAHIIPTLYWNKMALHIEGDSGAKI